MPKKRYHVPNEKCLICDGRKHPSIAINNNDLLTIDWFNNSDGMLVTHIAINYYQSITDLNDNMFNFMHNYTLKHLDLAYNKIKKVNFTNAIYLPKNLYLGYNQITHFLCAQTTQQQYYQSHNSNIDLISLVGNGITNLNSQFFRFPANVNRLDLSSNNIVGMINHRTTTKTIALVKELYLGYNQITGVNHDYLPEITYLSDNQISHIKSQSPQLKTLRVVKNPTLTNIDCNNFNHSLNTIYVSKHTTVFNDVQNSVTVHNWE